MVSLERQGLGASIGLTLLGVPGDGSERPSLLGIEGDSPGLWGWASFGFGATGGLCMPEERKRYALEILFTLSPLNPSLLYKPENSYMANKDYGSHVTQ